MAHECLPVESFAADVKKYGFSVVRVYRDEDSPDFAFSMGLYHTYKHTELFVCGLAQDLNGWVINELAERIGDGEKCEVDRLYDGLLEGYQCTFRNVPKGCYPDYFGYTRAFYKGDDFPALQLVWPDKENKWPWEIDFNHQWIWSQPLLAHWPDEKTKSHWVFDEPRNLGVFTTTRVLDDNHPVLLVCHGDDGDWQFLCGTTNDSDHARLICLNDMVKLDPSVNEVADLPLGWRAWRENVGAEWYRETETSEEFDMSRRDALKH